MLGWLHRAPVNCWRTETLQKGKEYLLLSRTAHVDFCTRMSTEGCGIVAEGTRQHTKLTLADTNGSCLVHSCHPMPPNSKDTDDPENIVESQRQPIASAALAMAGRDAQRALSPVDAGTAPPNGHVSPNAAPPMSAFAKLAAQAMAATDAEPQAAAAGQAPDATPEAKRQGSSTLDSAPSKSEAAPSGWGIVKPQVRLIRNVRHLLTVQSTLGEEAQQLRVLQTMDLHQLKDGLQVSSRSRCGFPTAAAPAPLCELLGFACNNQSS